MIGSVSRRQKPYFFLVDVLRHFQLDDVADCRRDDVLVVLEVVAFLGDLAEGAGKVLRDAGLLGDDEGFGHEGMPSRPRWRGLQVRSMFGVLIHSTDRACCAPAASAQGYDSLTKYLPGSCLTRRFNSRRSRTDETVALGSSLAVVICRSAFRSAWIAS